MGQHLRHIHLPPMGMGVGCQPVNPLNDFFGNFFGKKVGEIHDLKVQEAFAAPFNRVAGPNLRQSFNGFVQGVNKIDLSALIALVHEVLDTLAGIG